MFNHCRKLVAAIHARPGRALLVLAALLILGWGAYLGGLHLWAWFHYRAAVGALERRDLQEARDHLEACLSVWPGSASTHFLAARTARRCNCFDAVDFLGGMTPGRLTRLEEAMDHLEACERLAGPAEDITLEWDLLRAQQGKLAEVEKKLQACLGQHHPDSLLILEVLSWELMRLHRLTEAQAALDLWLEQRPSDREALLRRGWVREHLMNPHGAIEDYQSALDLDPEKDRGENDRLRLRLAQLLNERNRPKEALPHWVILLERQPDDAEVLLGTARCRRQLRQTDQAKDLLAKLLARQPRDGRTLGERGRLELDRGNAAEAERWLRKAVAQRPWDREIVYTLFRCLRTQAKTEEARKYSSRLNRIRDDEKQMSVLMRQVLRAPDDPDLCCRIGRIFLRNGHENDGRYWLAKALRRDPWHRAAHLALAEHFEKKGQKDLAARHRKVLEQIQTRGTDSASQ